MYEQHCHMRVEAMRRRAGFPTKRLQSPLDSTPTQRLATHSNSMILYGITIVTSAFLLFLVQPIIAKQILPWFGTRLQRAA